MQIVLKRKHGSQWFDLNKQFVDANKIRDFFARNSKLRIRFHEVVTVFLGIFTNSFVRIREGFQHVLLRIACTVCVSVR